MSEWLKVIILGIVEGITEFLPISSTGHLIVAEKLLDFQNGLDGTFALFIQLGAIIALILYYRREIYQQVRSVTHDSSVQRFWLGIVIASIPVGIIGLLFRQEIKVFLWHPLIIAIALIVGGVVFLLIERHPPTERVTDEATEITLRQAGLVGIAQVFALIPGVSRSGATIVGSLYAGLDRRAATQFSFYLAIPALGVATILEFLDVFQAISNDQLMYLILGALVSGVVAWLAIDWLLRYVSSNNFVIFGYYRIAAGIIILAALAGGLL